MISDITRMKDEKWYEDEELMKSAPNSPETERKKQEERPNSEMKTDKVLLRFPAI